MKVKITFFLLQKVKIKKIESAMEIDRLEFDDNESEGTGSDDQQEIELEDRIEASSK